MAQVGEELVARAALLGVTIPGTERPRRRTSETRRAYQRDLMARRRQDPDLKATELLRQAAQDRARRILAREFPDRYRELYAALLKEVGIDG